MTPVLELGYLYEVLVAVAGWWWLGSSEVFGGDMYDPIDSQIARIVSSLFYSPTLPCLLLMFTEILN